MFENTALRCKKGNVKDLASFQDGKPAIIKDFNLSNDLVAKGR